MQRILHSLMTFVIVAAAYTVYAAIAVPWIERPPKAIALAETADTDFVRPESKYDALLRLYFGDTDWERGAVNVVRSRQFLLLWKSHRAVESSRLRVKPLSIVFREGGWDDVAARDESTSGQPASNRRVWIVRAPAGATLEFQSLNVSAGQYGRFLAGYIPGSVTATGFAQSQATPRHAARNDPSRIEVLAQNLQFDDEQLWSSHPIELHWGRSYASGRDLTVKFARGLDPQADDVGAPRSAIESIRLMHLDQLHFAPPGQDNQGSSNRPSTPIDVRATGPLLVNLEQGTAELQQEVAVERFSDNAARERLRCDRLAVFFRDSRNRTAKKSGRTSKSDRHEHEFDIPSYKPVRVVATGQPVLLESQEAGEAVQAIRYRVEAVQVDYDLREPGPEPALDGLSGPGPAMPAVRRPGEATVIGPARIVADWAETTVASQAAVAGEPRDQQAGRHHAEFEWAGTARWHPSTMQAVFVVEQEVRISESTIGQLRADRLALQLFAKRQVSPSGSESAGSAKGLTLWQPQFVHAQGNVNIESTVLNATTNEIKLELIADQEPIVDNDPEANPNELILGDANPYVGSKTPGMLSGANGRRTRLGVDCDQIAIQLAGAGKPDMSIPTAVFTGKVRCAEVPTIPGQSSRFGVEGEFAQLIDLAPNRGRVEVVGQPAVIRAHALELTGPNVNLDVGANQAWIDGPGMASFPLGKSASVRDSGPPQRGTLTWNRDIRFDGQTLVCGDGISIRGPFQLIRAQSLSVRLKQPFRMGDYGRSNISPDIEATEVGGGVFLENRTLDQNGIAAIDSAQLKSLTIHHSTGAIEGEGPGRIETVRHGTTGLVPDPAVPGQHGAEALSFVQVQFQRGLSGSLNRREIKFFDNIHAVYGPVNDWSTPISASRREDLPADAFLLRCQELLLMQTPRPTPGATPLEIVAYGNTTIEGADFSATADRLSYDQSKDLLILEGTNRGGARISYRDAGGSQRSENVARKLEFRPKTKRLKIDDLQFFEFRTRGKP